jgi:hypothetical protein
VRLELRLRHLLHHLRLQRLLQRLLLLHLLQQQLPLRLQLLLLRREGGLLRRRLLRRQHGRLSRAGGGRALLGGGRGAGARSRSRAELDTERWPAPPAGPPDLKLGLSEKTVLSDFHQDAQKLFNVCCDMRAMFNKLTPYYPNARFKQQDVRVRSARARRSACRRVPLCCTAAGSALARTGGHRCQPR